MKKFKSNIKGITLVALVITIIILLILATISIQSLTNTGLFKRAKEAKNAMENAEAEQALLLNEYENALNGYYTPETISDGATVTPINDVTIWLKTGGLSKQYSYTTIEEVIADNTCTESLMNNENAMKYLARSTGFADAICSSETAMTYLGQSPYLNDTVLNNDSWRQSIKESQYWTLVYKTKMVTVYGAASETITIEGYYNASFSTGTDGSCSHVVPIDIITLTGSISGQSFTKTITNETTEIKVMPEGALYWYGNECTWISGGWSTLGYTSSYFYNGIYSAIKETNYIYQYQNPHKIRATNFLGTQKTIDLSRYKKIYFTVDGISIDNGSGGVISLNSKKCIGNDILFSRYIDEIGLKTFSSDFNLTGSAYLVDMSEHGYEYATRRTHKTYAIWLE